MSWWRTLGRRAYHAAPSGFWRGLQGLAWDLRSLPARWRDPERRGDPWQALHNVGGGDYRDAGLAGMAMLRTQAALQPGDAVLDIGCGNGRMTLPLFAYLDPAGRYVGFDVSRAAIDFCRRRYGSRPGFGFHHLDIHNGVYNPGGKLTEGAVRFPVEDASIDVAFATSVFTHLSMDAIRHYLTETRRVLRPGGRAVFTAFVLTDRVRAAIAEGRASLPMQPYGESAMTLDPHWPENGVAYDAPLFHAAVQDAGLTLTRMLHGDWSGAGDFAGGQDVLVVQR